MSFISYAQNFEDVMLWRALKHIECGFYIDVGAYDPEMDSVTKAFYDRGWRGINIEPVAQWYERLREARTRDINLQLAAGAEAGELRFYEVPDTGLSTMDKSIAERHETERGYKKQERVVPVSTLTEICRQYHETPIHFLKIDVEGGEKQVLAGLDMTRIRPWILVVESTLPNTQIEDHEEWESAILEADYQSVYFDGLNRFYVANEHHELKASFKIPPNVFDDFIRSQQLYSERRAQEQEQRAVVAEHRISELEQFKAGLEAKVTELNASSHLWWQQARQLEQQVQMYANSRSWRYTYPLRATKAVLAGGFPPLATAAGKAVAWPMRQVLRRPVLSQRIKHILQRFPKLRARLFTLAQRVDVIPGPAHGHFTGMPAPTTRIGSRCDTQQLLVDVSELANHDAGTGVQRVVREILFSLLDRYPPGYVIRPVYGTVYEPGYRYARIDRETGKIEKTDDMIDVARGDVFIGLDLQHHVVIRNKAFFRTLRASEVGVFFFVYDLLPIRLPDKFPSPLAELHAQWLRVIVESDGCICGSRTVTDELRAWLAENGSTEERYGAIHYIRLGYDFTTQRVGSSAARPPAVMTDQMASRPTFLMVGTLEPRKGYALTLAAFELLWQQAIDVNLVIVGKAGWMVDALVKRIRSHAESGYRLFWIDDADDAYLETLYSTATCLIAASEGEGYGLPIAEAARRGLPVIARDIPVFREVIGDAVCYFRGDDPEALAGTLRCWLTEDRDEMVSRISGVEFPTWTESTRQLIDLIIDAPGSPFLAFRNSQESELSVDRMKNRIRAEVNRMRSSASIP